MVTDWGMETKQGLPVLLFVGQAFSGTGLQGTMEKGHRDFSGCHSQLGQLLSWASVSSAVLPVGMVSLTWAVSQGFLSLKGSAEDSHGQAVLSRLVHEQPVGAAVR